MNVMPLSTFHLPPSRRRYLSAFLAFGVVVCIAAVPLTMLDYYVQRSEEISQLNVEIKRLRKRADVSDGQPSADQPILADEIGLFAQSVDAGAAHLQSVLRDLPGMLGTDGIQVDSVRVLPAQPEGPANAARVSASLNTPGSRVFDIVNALETATPPVIIDGIRIVTRLDAGGLQRPQHQNVDQLRAELTLVLRVYARTDASDSNNFSMPRTQEQSP